MNAHTSADEVKAVADRLIFVHFKELIPVRLEYVFTAKTTSRNGIPVWGQARKIGSLTAFLAGKKEDQQSGDTE